LITRNIEFVRESNFKYRLKYVLEREYANFSKINSFVGPISLRNNFDDNVDLSSRKRRTRSVGRLNFYERLFPIPKYIFSFFRLRVFWPIEIPAFVRGTLVPVFGRRVFHAPTIFVFADRAGFSSSVVFLRFESVFV